MMMDILARIVVDSMIYGHADEILSSTTIGDIMIKSAILDDEPRGSWLLEQKLKLFSPEMKIEAIYNNPEEALADIGRQKIHVLFLDVEMPRMNGFQFLERLGTFNFDIIFTTAYDKYILDALHQSAVDYLLKPIDENHLGKAISRLKKRIAEKEKYIHTPLANTSVQKSRLAVSTIEGIHLIEKSAIIRIEALGNCSAFVMADNKKIVVSNTLKNYESILSEAHFMRINRSAIVNLEFITKYKRGDGGRVVLTDGTEIEVSSNKKDELIARLF
ncbi:MAG: LytTR family DNA-binding domain-containing protein [Chitinophagaceae bacterium]